MNQIGGERESSARLPVRGEFCLNKHKFFRIIVTFGIISLVSKIAEDE